MAASKSLTSLLTLRGCRFGQGWHTQQQLAQFVCFTMLLKNCTPQKGADKESLHRILGATSNVYLYHLSRSTLNGRVKNQW